MNDLTRAQKAISLMDAEDKAYVLGVLDVAVDRLSAEFRDEGRLDVCDALEKLQTVKGAALIRLAYALRFA